MPPTTRFPELINNKDGRAPATMRSLMEAEKLLLRCLRLNPSLGPVDLLNLTNLRQLLELVGIDGWIPVESMPSKGYASWLGVWKKGDGAPSIAIDQSAYTEIVQGGIGSRRSKTVVFSIISHEIGHEVMRDRSEPRQFVKDMGRWLAANQAELYEEAEAWIFAGFLRAFIFADIGSEKRPDETATYM